MRKKNTAMNFYPLVLLLIFGGVSVQGGQDFFDLPPIRYSQTASQDAVAKMAAEIEHGDWVIGKVDGKTFLKAVLKKLNIPEESQVLVFSKTSFQNSLINQNNPRSIYFSMDAYVGWVPGGKVEVIIEDEKLGPVFYTIDPPFGDRRAKIVRATDSCLQCHATSRTSGVPGMFIRSVVPDQNSHPILSAGTSLVTDSTPLRERWGGWYVSGHTDAPHLGNRWVPESVLSGAKFKPEVSDHEDLSSLINTEKYLQPTSDIVALMVLEHQCRTHNLITKAKMGYQRALYFQKSYSEGKDLGSHDGMSWKMAESSAKEIVDSFLFASEIDPGGDGVEGADKFAEAFKRGGVKTAKGKSLRDLRLYGRLFKNRCSYMIHSLAFKGLPELIKERVYYHLREELANEADNHLSSREKKILLGILEETVPGFRSEP
ncbi:MAG: hypothetical protein P8Q54_07585 [Akkermansiaceae bacterium]|nr:hypothetical protein [Akkermansiaceae bacterium]